MSFKKGDRVVLKGKVGVGGVVDVVGPVTDNPRFPSGVAVNVVFDKPVAHPTHGTGSILSFDEAELELRKK